MKCKWFCALFVLSILITTSSILAADEGEGCKVVSLFGGWARASVEGAPNGAAFGYVVNLSDTEDTLLSVSSEAAEAVEIHEMVMGDNDVMQMHPIEGGLVIAPHSYQELQPGGLHIMLINLKQPLEAGKLLDITLHFETAGDVMVQVPIRDMTAMDEQPMAEATQAMDMMPSDHPEMTIDPACQKMYVLNPWVRAANAGMPTSAAYGLALNLTDKDDTLTGVSTDVAMAELHQMSIGDNDVMQMTPVEGGIAVPKGAAVALKPGDYHVMLMGLKNTLDAGTTVNMTWTFAEAGAIELTVPVQEPSEDSMSPMGGMSGG